MKIIGRNVWGFNFLRGNNLESPGNLKRLNCGLVSHLITGRCVRLRTSRMRVANLERRRITMEAQKRERRKNRKQDNDTAVCVFNVCDHNSAFRPPATNAIIPRIISSS